MNWFYAIKLYPILNFLHVISAFLIIGCGAAAPISLELSDNYPAANKTQEAPDLNALYLPLHDILEQMYQLIQQEEITKKNAIQQVCSNSEILNVFEQTTSARNKQLKNLEQGLKNLQSKEITINGCCCVNKVKC